MVSGNIIILLILLAIFIICAGLAYGFSPSGALHSVSNSAAGEGVLAVLAVAFGLSLLKFGFSTLFGSSG